MSLLLIIATAAGLLAWSAVARIDEAVAVTGEVSFGGHAVPVQHVAGGVVKTVQVADGGLVEAGQVVLVLRDTEGIRRGHAQLMARYANAVAERGYLDAILDGRQRLGPIPSIQGGIRIPADRQRRLRLEYQAMLEDYWRARQSDDAVVAEELAGTLATAESTSGTRRRLERERSAARAALEKSSNGARRAQLRARLSDLAVQIDQLDEQRDQAAAMSGTLEAQRRQLSASADRDTRFRMIEVQAQIDEVADQLRAASAKIGRLTVRAPSAGVVHMISPIEPGVVIGAGTTPAEIVSNEKSAMVNIRVPPHDIDAIQVGSRVSVTLTGLGQESPSDLEAVVEAVPANVVIDQSSQTTYYAVQARLSRAVSVGLRSGMPVEGFIATGEKSVLSYLVGPLVEQIRRPLPAGS